MKKLYRIFILLLAATFLTTFNPKDSEVILYKNNNFFKIKNIKILNNSLIKTNSASNKVIIILVSLNIFLHHWFF